MTIEKNDGLFDDLAMESAAEQTYRLARTYTDGETSDLMEMAFVLMASINGAALELRALREAITEKPEAPAAGEWGAPDLTGQFFHTRNEDGSLEWQGVVVGEVRPGIFQIQLFEWMTGTPSTRRVVRLEDMIGWDFYQSEKTWRYKADTENEARFGAARAARQGGDADDG